MKIYQFTKITRTDPDVYFLWNDISVTIHHGNWKTPTRITFNRTTLSWTISNRTTPTRTTPNKFSWKWLIFKPTYRLNEFGYQLLFNFQMQMGMEHSHARIQRKNLIKWMLSIIFIGNVHKTSMILSWICNGSAHSRFYCRYTRGVLLDNRW